MASSTINQHSSERRIIRTLVPIIIFLVLLSVIFGISGIRRQTRSELKDNLETVLTTTRNALDIWARENETRASLWANTRSSRRNIRRQLDLQRAARPETVQKTLTNSSAQQDLSSRMEPMLGANGFIGYVVLDLNGLILSANDERLIGHNMNLIIDAPKLAQPLADAKNNIMKNGVMIPPFRQTDALIPNYPTLMMAVAPVREQGRTIALFGLLLDPRKSLTETTQLGRFGKSGETYAFDQTGRLVTESRFEQTLIKTGIITPGESPILNVELRDPGTNLLRHHDKPSAPREQQPYTRMAQSALAHQSGFDLTGYRDYRGIEVAGAWLWDSKLNLGLATEIDVNEAYQPFFITRMLVFAMLAVTIIGAILIETCTWVHSRSLMRAVRSLEETRHMLQESVQARNEFISVAAHELRTPLTSLRLQLDLIQNLINMNSIHNYPKEKLLRITSVSSAEIERFSKIIRNLLDASQLSKEPIRLELHDFDLMQKIRDIRFQYAEQIRRNGCSLTIHGPQSLIVHWDRSQIEQVLANLLSNAMKFGKGHPIEIEVQNSDDNVQISVTDHGIGIKKEDQSKIFDKFERAGAINPEGGLGLGLFLVNKIIERHQGKISVKSEFGQGSTFTLSIPRVLKEGIAPARLAA